MLRRYSLVALAALVAASFCSARVDAQEALPEASQRVSSGGAVTQYVELNAQGQLVGVLSRFGEAGKLYTIANQNVSLIHAGRVVAVARTDADGSFSFGGVKPGVHTLSASNAKYLLLQTVMVGGPRGDAAPLSLVAAGPVSPERRTAMLATMVGGARPVMGAPQGGGSAFVGTPGAATMDMPHTAALSADGRLSGRLSWQLMSDRPVSFEGMVLRLTRDGQIVGETRVAGDGSYTISGMVPGPVSVFAFGPQGMSAFGVKLVPAQTVLGQQANNLGETFVVAAQDEPTGGLDFSPTGAGDVVAASEEEGDSLNLPPTGTTGGVAGGGSFGGGGGGGGGGLGGVGALGAIGAAIAIAASDDDDGAFVPPATSPNGS